MNYLYSINGYLSVLFTYTNDTQTHFCKKKYKNNIEEHRIKSGSVPSLLSLVHSLPQHLCTYIFIFIQISFTVFLKNGIITVHEVLQFAF